MKKIFAILALSLFFAACGSSDSDDTDQDKDRSKEYEQYLPGIWVQIDDKGNIERVGSVHKYNNNGTGIIYNYNGIIDDKFNVDGTINIYNVYIEKQPDYHQIVYNWKAMSSLGYEVEYTTEIPFLYMDNDSIEDYTPSINYKGVLRKVDKIEIIE